MSELLSVFRASSAADHQHQLWVEVMLLLATSVSSSKSMKVGLEAIQAADMCGPSRSWSPLSRATLSEMEAYPEACNKVSTTRDGIHLDHEDPSLPLAYSTLRSRKCGS